MSENNLKIGAGIGAAAGAGAGLARGAKKAAEIMKPFVGKDGKPNVDTYVDSRVKANTEGIINYFAGSAKKLNNAFRKVAQKAKEDYTPALESALKKAKSIKIKSVAAFAVAGAGIGAGIAFITNKIKNSKTEKAE